MITQPNLPDLTHDILVGAFLPLLIALINQCHWTEVYKKRAAALTCFVAALIVGYLRGYFVPVVWDSHHLAASGTSFLTTFATILTFSKQVWDAFWKDNGGQSIEVATTFTRPGLNSKEPGSLT